MRKSLGWFLAVSIIVMLVSTAVLAAPIANLKSATAVSLDKINVPKHDFSRANKLPMTGYFEKSFTMKDNSIRTAKVYIPENTPVRAYYTVIAVPDGVNTGEFLDKTGWKALADKRQEGLYVLEPGKGGWADADKELEYVTAAINFFANPVDPKAAKDDFNNRFFSIFGEHYLVGYKSGAPALEAWAAAYPLRVIGQVYIDSKGLKADYFKQFATMEFGGKNAIYNEIMFPEGFKKITYNQVVVPTWYIHPDRAAISDSLAYWKSANDCAAAPIADPKFGLVYKQKAGSDRWMTNFSGPISKLAILDKLDTFTVSAQRIYDFPSYYSRYENMVAYANQLIVRADYAKLGIQIKTMVVNGFEREYMVYVPDSAKKLWGAKAPVLFVFPGDSQTDKVFLDATQWWKVAQDKGFVMVINCEQYNKSSVAVSHLDTDAFYRQLRAEIFKNYPVDPGRVYATGQSAGSMLSQTFGAAKPEYFAAAASTSGPPSPDAKAASGSWPLYGDNFTLSDKMFPTYMIYGAGDLAMLKGDLWDTEINGLDDWAKVMLGANGFTLSPDDKGKAVYSNYIGGLLARYKTWTWSKNIGGQNVALVKLTQNIYRSHNCIFEEMPMLWDFLEHYSYEVDANNVVTARYYSPSGFKVAGDKVRIYPSNP
jgi:hypothetical protein